jgi:hypothetical protein
MTLRSRLNLEISLIPQVMYQDCRVEWLQGWSLANLLIISLAKKLKT